jgi:hypothetical protein
VRIEPTLTALRTSPGGSLTMPPPPASGRSVLIVPNPVADTSETFVGASPSRRR